MGAYSRGRLFEGALVRGIMIEHIFCIEDDSKLLLFPDDHIDRETRSSSLEPSCSTQKIACAALPIRYRAHYDRLVTVISINVFSNRRNLCSQIEGIQALKKSNAMKQFRSIFSKKVHLKVVENELNLCIDLWYIGYDTSRYDIENRCTYLMSSRDLK